MLVDGVVDVLKSYGKKIKPELPRWHHSRDPYEWFVAELLLRRTIRTAAERAFEELISKYTNWKDLANARRSEIKDLVSCVGLGNQRSKHLLALASKILEDYDGSVPIKRDRLTELPGVGEYTTDAIHLYVHGLTAFPMDAGIQRALRRLDAKAIPENTEHTNPYQDPYLHQIATSLCQEVSSSDLAAVHRGTLAVSWKFCKKEEPICTECCLESVCEVGQASQNSLL
jgi:endonuclease III